MLSRKRIINYVTTKNWQNIKLNCTKIVSRYSIAPWGARWHRVFVGMSSDSEFLVKLIGELASFKGIMECLKYRLLLCNLGLSSEWLPLNVCYFRTVFDFSDVYLVMTLETPGIWCRLVIKVRRREGSSIWRSLFWHEIW